MPQFNPKANATHVWSLPFEGEWPTAVAFLGDTRKLAAGDRGGQILLWDLPEKAQPADKKAPLPSETAFEPPQPVRRLDGHTNAITRLVALDDGRTLLSASLDRTIRVWNTSAPAAGTAEVVMDVERRERESKGRRKEQVQKLSSLKVETQTAVQALTEHAEWVKSLAKSGDGSRLISGDDGGTVIVREAATGKPVSRWKVEDWVTTAALSPDARLALVAEFRSRRGDFDQTAPRLNLYDAATGKVVRDLFTEKDRRKRIAFFGRGLTSSAFSPDGSIVAVCKGGETDYGHVHLIDVAGGKLLHTIQGHRYGATDLCFSADGKYVLSCGRDTTIRISNVADGKEAAVLGKSRGGQFKDWLHGIALSADEAWVAAADIAGKVQVWRMGG